MPPPNANNRLEANYKLFILRGLPIGTQNNLAPM